MMHHPSFLISEQIPFNC